MYTGVAGALGAIAVQFVAPDSFNIFLSITLLVGIVVGGLASISGALYGALFIQFVPNIADEISKAAPWAIFGVFMIGFVYLMPTGVAGAIRLLSAKRRVTMKTQHRCSSRISFGLALPAAAQKKYDPGASDREIKIGNTNPYSGPASAYGTIGKSIAAYFKMVNEQGGINGRKINFITYDDSYSPPKTVEMARKLVEQDEVLFVFQTLGTPSNTAIHKYMNMKKVPQMHVATGATKWNDPKEHSLDHGLAAELPDRGAGSTRSTSCKTKPNAKIAVLYQNDDYGKDYLEGPARRPGRQAKSMIVKEVSYEVSDPTVDSQIVQLQASGADVFFNITTPKFAAHGDPQGLRHRLEAGAVPEQRLDRHRLGADARRAWTSRSA